MTEQKTSSREKLVVDDAGIEVRSRGEIGESTATIGCDGTSQAKELSESEDSNYTQTALAADDVHFASDTDLGEEPVELGEAPIEPGEAPVESGAKKNIEVYEADIPELARYRGGFLQQGMTWMVGYTLMWLIPAFTMGRWLPELYTMNHYVSAGIGVGIALTAINGLWLSLVGGFFMTSGLSYVRRAQQFVHDDAKQMQCTMKLKLRKKNYRSYDSILCDGELTYSDGRTETIKLLARDIEMSELLEREAVPATLYGEPFATLQPRVVATAAGDLLAQPNQCGLAGGGFKLFNGVKDPLSIKCPALMRECQNSALALIFVTIFAAMFLAYNRTVGTEWLIPALVASIAFAVARFRLVFNARRLVALRDPQTAALRLDKAARLDLNEIPLSMIVTGEGVERRDTMWGKAPPSALNKHLDAQVWFKNGAPWMVATSDFVLFKSRVYQLVWIPLILAIISLPLSIHQARLEFQSAKTAPITATSAEELYRKGVQYKALGLTEKAREALTRAGAIDHGSTGQAALSYLHSHIPVYAVPEAAEKLNIKAHNKSFRKPEKAKALWREAIKKYPTFEWPYSNLAVQLMSEGENENAVMLLQTALGINPNYTNALHNMYVAQTLLGRRELGIAYLRRSAESDPENPFARIELFFVEHSI